LNPGDVYLFFLLSNFFPFPESFILIMHAIPRLAIPLFLVKYWNLPPACHLPSGRLEALFQGRSPLPLGSGTLEIFLPMPRSQSTKPVFPAYLVEQVL